MLCKSSLKNRIALCSVHERKPVPMIDTSQKEDWWISIDKLYPTYKTSGIMEDFFMIIESLWSYLEHDDGEPLHQNDDRTYCFITN